MATWKAGLASSVITPSEPMWLAGWASRTKPSCGTLSDLYAKALAIEDQHGSRAVLVSLDLIAVSRELSRAVADRVEQNWSLPRERLLFCATHTHCGPEIRPDKVPFFHIPPQFADKIQPYVDWLAGQLVNLIGEALDSLQPARFRGYRTTTTFAHNRRARLSAPEVDHDVPILEVTALDGCRRAIVLGYACHNTALPPEDGRYCGDYSGFAQAVIEASGIPFALFIPGAGADQDPEPRGTVELAQQHGRSLAEAVLQEINFGFAGREIDGALLAAYDEILLDFQQIPEKREILQANTASDDLPTRTKAQYLLARLKAGKPLSNSYPCPLQVISLGDSLLLIAIGGEPVVEYSHLLKQRYSAQFTRGPGQRPADRIVWVAGYANDMFGYVPTARMLREGGYEGNRSLLWSALPAPFAENTQDRVLSGVDRLMDRITEAHSK